jgi:hypothetical protein
MNIKQVKAKSKDEIIIELKSILVNEYDFHILFCDKKFIEDEELNQLYKNTFASSLLMGCSTAGEIGEKNFSEHSFVLTSVKLNKSKVKKSVYHLTSVNDSHKAGETIAKDLLADDLKYVFVLSEGLNVNGTRLIEGINSILDEKVNVSGGLAGDDFEFVKTYVCDEENKFSNNCIAALGFYGDALETASGSHGGWDSFGIDRVVTKSEENIVYEIDGQPALQLYKSYLGEKAAELPGSALFFPLEMRTSENGELLVRTILGVNEQENSLTFAGNIPEGSFVRLMKTNVNRVIGGAEKSSELIKEGLINDPKLIFMISCVGRKMVLKQLTQDEIDAVTESFDDEVVFTGFYSYGELSKLKGNNSCALHNQTMTVAGITEI